MDTASVRTSPVYRSVVINRGFIGVQRKVLSQRSGGGKDFPLRGNHHVKRFGAEIVNLFVPQSHNTVICRNRLRCDHIALRVIGKPDYTIVGDRGQRLVFIVITSIPKTCATVLPQVISLKSMSMHPPCLQLYIRKQIAGNTGFKRNGGVPIAGTYAQRGVFLCEKCAGYDLSVLP